MKQALKRMQYRFAVMYETPSTCALSPDTDMFYLSGQMDAVKIMAKDLVRTRRYVKKFMLMKANIQAVSLKIQTLKSQNAMAEAMKVNTG